MILLVQFWEGDKAQAMALARLMADLESTKREDVTMVFCARYDAKHDDETIAYCANKFKVDRFTCKRRIHGWPSGPNNMVSEGYGYCVESHRFGKLKGDIVMLIEADCVPLHKNWINILSGEFHRSGKKAGGAWLKKGDAGIEHVNGNMLLSIDLWRECRDILLPVGRGGWDAVIAPRLLPFCYPSKYIWSDYQLGMPHNPWKGCDYLWEPKRYASPHNHWHGHALQPVYFHGVKTMDGIECARKRLL